MIPQITFENLLNDISLSRPSLSVETVKKFLLNGEQYLAENPDVKKSDICPVYHFYNYGFSEGRSFCQPKFRSITKLDRINNGKKVVFCDTIKSNASFLYRGCFLNKGNSLVNLMHQDSDFFELIQAVFFAQEVVFLRPAKASFRTAYLLELSVVLNILITFDYDDLLLPEYTLYKGAVRSGVSSYNSLQNSLTRDSALLLNASRLVCSTKRMSDIFHDFVDEVTVCKNKLPTEYFIDKKDVLKKEFCRNSKVNILYLSGTKTHLKDYSVISGILIKLAQNYPDRFSLSFMGKLEDQTSIFSLLGLQCQYIPFLSFHDMINKIGEYDLVLVPLEDTIFNNAKSNIKFIESASQGVPIIASAVDEYVLSIQHGSNGWLCQNDKEWYETLEAILLHMDILPAVALRAYESALSEYSI